MAVLDDVGTLIGKSASLSLPGIVAACAFVIFLWPPAPKDMIEAADLCSAHPGGACRNPYPAEKVPNPELWCRGASTNSVNLPDTAPAFRATFPIRDKDKEGKEEFRRIATYTADAGTPACETKFQALPRPSTIFDYHTPVAIQQTLDCQIQTFGKCVEEETATQGQEETLLKNIDATITQLTTELGKLNDAAQGYAASNNPLRFTFQDQVDERKAVIAQWQALSVRLKLAELERTRRMQDYTRQQKILTDRQADPGRLRPRQRIDDVLSSLGSHLTGFITLALAWSMLLTPLSQVGFSSLYSKTYKYNWDYVRADRGPPLTTLLKIARQVSSGN